MKDYKKRAKAGWNVGKAEKESSNRSERSFIKKELSREIPISSEDERLSLKNEIASDEYDRETFRELAKERPDLIRDPIIPVKKKKKKTPSKKALESKIAYFQKKLEALRPDGYGTGRLKNYYTGTINEFKKILESIKKG